jgi:hypothetical protein
MASSRIVPILVLALACALAFGWIVQYPTSLVGFNDAIEYMRLAEAIGALVGGGSESQTEDHVATLLGSRFPPLFPAVLASFGVGEGDLHDAGLASCLLAAVSVLTVALWGMRDSSSNSGGFCLGLALALLPGFFLMNLYPAAEPLGMAMLYAAFLALAGRTTSKSEVITAAVLVGLAPLVRLAFLPITVAFAIFLVRFRNERSIVTSAAILAAGPSMAWLTLSSLLSTQSYADFISAELFRQHLTDLTTPAWSMPARIVDGLAANWHPLAGWPLFIAAAALSVAMLIGFAVRLRALKIDALFVAGYVPLILAWPFPFELPRLLLPVYPVLMVFLGEALKTAARSGVGPRLISMPHGLTVASLIALALSAPAIGQFVRRALLPVPPELSSEAREPVFFTAESNEAALTAVEVIGRVRHLLIESRAHVGEGECVYATIPHVVRQQAMLVSYDYPAGLQGMPHDEALLWKCNFFLVSGFASAQLNLPPLYPLHSLQGWTVPVLSSEMEVGGELLPAAVLLKRKPVAQGDDANTPMPGQQHGMTKQQ